MAQVRSGRKPTDLIPYKDEFLDLVSVERSQQNLIDHLLNRHKVSVSRPD
jgi:hypothetical protein